MAAALVAVICSLSPTTARANHVGCGDVITQDITLDSDLIDCPLSGLVIGAPGIQVDLNGHIVDGRGRFASSAPGIANVGGFDGVTIKSGTVREFEHGVVLFEVTGASLDGLSVLANNITGIRLSDSLQNTITRSTAMESGFGIEVAGSSENVIARNTLLDNGGGGIVLAGSAGNLVEKNDLAGNARGNVSAVALYSSTANRIEKNDVHDNPNFGIYLSRSAANRVEANTADRNFAGIVAGYQSHDNVIVGNGAGENRTYGLWAEDGASANYLEQNSTRRNGSTGIFVSGAGNAVIDNTAVENAFDGIIVFEASGTVVDGNSTNFNGDDGIDVMSPGNSVGANHSNRNHDLGIDAVLGTTDAGGNRAHGNGNPVECVNVAC